ncbi:MAG: response regulator [Betaproteobacteria bacterium]|nr:response regulator [Betaproteobacteria bacterium]
MKPARILIADDEAAIAMSLEFLLSNVGYETRISRDGEEALRAASAFQPDLIVLDLMLPRLSGLEVCRALRADPQHCRLKVLMLTARGGPSDFARGQTAGVDAYQVKPFSTKDLLAQVDRLLAPEELSHAS